MPIDRYDHYGKPRLTVTENGDAYLIRNVLTDVERFSGVCEYGVYNQWTGETDWHICRPDVEFVEIKPFIPARRGDE